MMISGNSKALKAYREVVQSGSAIGEMVKGALESISNTNLKLSSAPRHTAFFNRDHVMSYLKDQGWLKVLSSGMQTYKLAPKLDGKLPEVVIVFSLHEEAMVWLQSVTFADGSEATESRIQELLNSPKGAR